MSSFKRKGQEDLALPGVRPSPFNAAPILSTGLNSIDDLLGGGLPLSAMMLIESDHPTAYYDLILDAFIAQGLDSQQDVLVVGSQLEGLAEKAKTRFASDESSEIAAAQSQGDMKIAFRYDKVKPVQVSVPETRSTSGVTGVPYCSLFDMTTRRELTVDEQSRLTILDVTRIQDAGDLASRISSTETYGRQSTKQRPLRLAIMPCSSMWYSKHAQSNRYAVWLRIKALLHQKNVSVLAVSPFQTATNRDRHLFDAVMQLRSFAGSPASEAAFPKHQGLVDIPRVPAIGTLVGGGIKLSILRKGGNLGFRVKRKRFVIENVGEDIDGAAAVPNTKSSAANVENEPQDSNRSQTESKVKFASVPIVLGSAKEREKPAKRTVRIADGPIDF